MICLQSVWVYGGYKELKSAKRVSASSQSGYFDWLRLLWIWSWILIQGNFIPYDYKINLVSCESHI